MYLQKQVLDRLGVKHLRMAIGGSMGSMLALEWAATFPAFTQLVLIAGCARHTDWAIAIGEAERFAVYADARFAGGAYDPSDPPSAGLAAARMTAMLTYRAPRSVDDRHGRSASRSIASIVETERAEHAELGLVPRAIPTALRSTLPRYDVENYLRYQGRKFAARFDPNCYVALTHTLDTHDVARGRAKKTKTTARRWRRYRTSASSWASRATRCTLSICRRSWHSSCRTRECTRSTPSTGTTRS